jgi:Ca2+-binding RTX toxin-like protein
MTVRKWGVESLVNTNITGNQNEPTIAALAGGGYVVAWTDRDDAGGDGSASSVKYQRYDDAGNKVGGEVIANVTAAGVQAESNVVGNDDGSFVIVWGDDTSNALGFRRFSANGGSLDATDVVQATSEHSASTTLGTGFIVAFEDTSAFQVLARRYFADGTPNGAEFDVSDSGGDLDGSPAVAELTGGSFVVAWRNISTDEILIRGFDSGGTQTFAAKDVSVPADAASGTPSITALANGSFVVAWETNNSIYPDTANSVRARVVSFAGSLIGSEFIVNTETTGIQGEPSLAALPGGGFVAVYTSDHEIRGQLFDNFGERVGDEFQVNTATDGDMVGPVVTVLADGRLAVSWTAFGVTGGDASGQSVHTQILDPRDGVVTGTDNGETLYGHNLVNDEINGLGGADTLIGLGGSDDLYGGDGGDTYIVGAGDTVFELFNGGTDTVRSSLSYTLGANVENLVLLADTTGTGNGLANTITGNAGANILDGGAGLDILFGAAGNDTYVLSNGTDTVTDTAGVDTITTTITRSLAGFATIENLTLLGTGTSNGTGNSLANTIIGNSAANRLTGLAGKDILTGNSGNDTFVYTLASDSHGATLDVIKDFDDHGNDRIDLSALFSGTLVYKGIGAITGAHQIHIHDIAGPDVLVEVNLSGSLAPEVIIRLANTTAASMTASDFVL